MEMPRVRCAVCNTPIERMMLKETADLMGHELVVFCHGEEDRMILSNHDLEAMGPEGVHQLHAQEGIAFVAKKFAVNDKALSPVHDRRR